MASIIKVDTIQDVNSNVIISSDGSGNLTPNTFTALTISGDLTVDTSTLKVDSANNRVGIGNSSPISLLTVGAIQETGTDRASIAVKTISNGLSIGEAAIQIEEQSGTEGYFIGVDSTGGLFFNNSGSATKTLYLGDDDNVGIGTDSPSQALDVVGSIEVSGNIYLGGTGSANALDDYETGTFSPTYLGSSSNPSVTYDTTVRYGAYTKIGRIVYFNLVNRTDAVSSSGSGDLRVGGLPFNADNSAFSTVTRYGCNIGGFTGFSTSGSNMTGYIINDYIELFETQGASAVSTSELVDGGNLNEIQITGFYVTSS